MKRKLMPIIGIIINVVWLIIVLVTKQASWITLSLAITATILLWLGQLRD